MEPHHGGLDPSMTQYFTGAVLASSHNYDHNYHIRDPCKCPDYTQYILIAVLYSYKYV